jgi:integrase
MRYLRDHFIFIFLPDAGLRASELPGANMRAIRPLSDPKRRKTYRVLEVKDDTAKGAKNRRVPVSTVLLDALMAYRKAFGLNPLLGNTDDGDGLILSVHTQPLAVCRYGGMIKSDGGIQNARSSAMKSGQSLHRFCESCAQS